MRRATTLAFASVLALTTMRPLAALADEPQPRPLVAKGDSSGDPAPTSGDSSATSSTASASFSTSEGGHSSGSAGKIIGYGLIGLGVVGIVIGGIEGARFSSLSSDADAARAKVSTSNPDPCNVPNDPNAATACQKNSDAGAARTLMWVFLGSGATLALSGVIVLAASSGSSDTQSASLQVLPHAGPRGGGLDVKLTF